jgi:hypothetical protein
LLGTTLTFQFTCKDEKPARIRLGGLNMSETKKPLTEEEKKNNRFSFIVGMVIALVIIIVFVLLFH